MNRIDFTIDGDVRGKGRPRFARNKNFVKTYTDEKTLSYENQVKFYAALVVHGVSLKYLGQFPLQSDCFVSIEVHVSIPSSWSEKKKEQARKGEIMPTTKPDLDNVAKIILDGMNGIVFKDDKQVTRLMISKMYSDRPRAQVSVLWQSLREAA